MWSLVCSVLSCHLGRVYFLSFSAVLFNIREVKILRYCFHYDGAVKNQKVDLSFHQTNQVIVNHLSTGLVINEGILLSFYIITLPKQWKMYHLCPVFLNEMVEFVGYTIGLIIGETSYRYVCNVTQKEI